MALIFQTKHTSDTGCLYSNVLLGDWSAERVSTIRFMRRICFSRERDKGNNGKELGIMMLTVCLKLGRVKC